MNLNLLEFVIYALATWRVSSLLVDEVGPFRIFIRLREWVGITHDADDNVAMIPDRLLPGILSCVWCCSIYVGLFWTIMYLLCGYSLYLALPFALSAAAIKLHPSQ
jgi:hypothetical protein